MQSTADKCSDESNAHKAVLCNRLISVVSSGMTGLMSTQVCGSDQGGVPREQHLQSYLELAELMACCLVMLAMGKVICAVVEAATAAVPR